MLDYMRRNTQSIVIIFVLGVLILAFIIEFGPQAKGCRAEDQRQREHQAHSVLTVLGYDVTDTEFELWRMHVGMQPGLSLGQRYMACYQTATALANLGPMAGAGNRTPALDESKAESHFRNAFLLREALVREAQRQGVAVDDEEIKHALSHGRIYIFDHGAWTDPSGGVHFCGGDLVLRIGLGRDGKFSASSLRAALQQQFSMSVDDFYAFERRNLLALKMQQILAAGAAVSPAEVEQGLRAENESVDLLVWSVGPAVGSDEEQSALQARFDQLRGAVPDTDVDVWLAQASNARQAEDRAKAASSSADGGTFDPARGKTEIARSLIAVDRLAQEVRDAARLVRGTFATPSGAPQTPPPVPEGIAVRSHNEALRPLAPAADLPPDLADAADIVGRVLALTEASPVLADDIEREAVAASVQDAAGERYALREVLLVRRTGPWDLEAAVQQAIHDKLADATTAALAAKRESLLDAWYATQLYAARAADNVDDQHLTEYLDSQRQQQQ